MKYDDEWPTKIHNNPAILDTAIPIIDHICNLCGDALKGIINHPELRNDYLFCDTDAKYTVRERTEIPS